MSQISRKIEADNAKTLELEKELAQYASTNNSKAHNIRTVLAEIFPSILIHDAAYAHRHKVLERLWQHCFYNTRINVMRKRITKLKSKLSKAEKQQHQNEVAELQEKYETEKKNLTVFLSETIDYYNFIIKQLRNILCKQVTECDGVNAGLVPSLHGLFVNLGDLYRYAEHHSFAQAAYCKAVELGPSHGIAHNLLGVISQIDGNHVFALYNYARCLSSQHVFSSAEGNLHRMLQSVLANAKTTESPTKLAPSKSMQSKAFMNAYVRLNATILENCKNGKNGSIDDLFLTETMGLLPNLLSLSVLSDSLLCKMVVIQAYVEHCTRSSFARWTTLLFGRALAERLVLLLTIKSQTTNFNPNSIRTLTPLLLLLEYLVQPIEFDDDNSDIAVETICAAKLADFGDSLTDVCYFLQTINLDCDYKDEYMELKEYMSVRGYVPFKFTAQLFNGYVSAKEAAGIVDDSSLYTQNKILTPDSAMSRLRSSMSNQGGGSMAEFQQKCSRFLTLTSVEASRNDGLFGGCLEILSSGAYSYNNTHAVRHAQSTLQSSTASQSTPAPAQKVPLPSQTNAIPQCIAISTPTELSQPVYAYSSKVLPNESTRITFNKAATPNSASQHSAEESTLFAHAVKSANKFVAKNNLDEVVAMDTTTDRTVNEPPIASPMIMDTTTDNAVNEPILTTPKPVLPPPGFERPVDTTVDDMFAVRDILKPGTVDPFAAMGPLETSNPFARMYDPTPLHDYFASLSPHQEPAVNNLDLGYHFTGKSLLETIMADIPSASKRSKHD